MTWNRQVIRRALQRDFDLDQSVRHSRQSGRVTGHPEVIRILEGSGGFEANIRQREEQPTNRPEPQNLITATAFGSQSIARKKLAVIAASSAELTSRKAAQMEN